MKTITVSASRNYDVIIDSNLLPQMGSFCLPFCPNHRVAIITDDCVAPLYLDTIIQSLKDVSISSVHYIIKNGESSKNGENYLNILSFLAENHLTRTDTLLALGGGVVGDLAGFVAATYLRGIGFIQVPTTLLAMVDSSVGGKTAIDLPVGKNLAGAFYQPHLVLCDIDTLKTLTDETFRDGCAEIIKYALLESPTLFEHLQECGINFDREAVISECITIKRNIVNQDEFESGPRKLLNLGHTVGHAIEQLSHFGISHGKAVAIGMNIATRCAEAMGHCPKGVANQTEEICRQFSLPTQTDYTSDSLIEVILSDKKRSGQTITFILPQKIGCCNLYPVHISDLDMFLRPGLSE